MKTSEKLLAYLENREILILDKNQATHSRIREILLHLKVSDSVIHAAEDFSEAEILIRTREIGIVFSDFSINGGSGLELFQIIREKHKETSQLAVILVSANLSQNAVSMAAEANVDSFILKPFTQQYFETCLDATIQEKLTPTPYIKVIDKGRRMIEGKEYQKAMVVLQEAIPLHKKPALALYYHGEANLQLTKTKAAKLDFSKGLSFNKVHFKCLNGLFATLTQESNTQDAYQVGRKLVKYYPANEARLSEIIRLAVKTENFQDMEYFYKVYQSLEEKNKSLTNYIGAGLFISGKYFLLKNDAALAITYFDKIVISCTDYPKYAKAIVDLLIKHELINEAKAYLERFPSLSLDAKEMEEYTKIFESIVSQKKTA